MRNISDTITRLTALRARQTEAAAAGTSLAELTGFGDNPGGLKAWTYLPRGLKGKLPLVVVLHGCTQSSAGYDHGSGWSALAEREGFAVLFAEQQRANNPNLCFNWFVPADTRRDSGEVASIARMIEAVVANAEIDQKRIFVTGLSAGGAMASTMLAVYPELFAGGAIIAGLAHGVANTIPEAFDRMRGHGLPSKADLQKRLREASDHDGPWPTISVWQGSADSTVAAVNAGAIVAQWSGVHRLDRQTPNADTVDGYPHRAWRDAKGRVLVEEFTITGMGHGTPLATKGEDGIGAPAPFMLEVGISSTLRIAQSWGIVRDRAETVRTPAGKASTASRAVANTVPRAADQPRRLRIEPKPKTAPQPDSTDQSSAVGKVITDALRAAGLMR